MKLEQRHIVLTKFFFFCHLVSQHVDREHETWHECKLYQLRVVATTSQPASRSLVAKKTWWLFFMFQAMTRSSHTQKKSSRVLHMDI